MKYTRWAALAYHIPVVAAYLALILGLARYELLDMMAIHAAILINSTFFIILVKRKREITKSDVDFQLLVQISIWLMIVTAWFLIMDDLRILILFASVLALFFVFVQTEFLLSLGAILLVSLVYLLVAYIGINHLGQAGQFGRELLYVLVFMPVSAFVAYQAYTLRQQHREIRLSAKRQLLHEERERAQQAELVTLQQADIQKEKLVAERTAQLAAANRELMALATRDPLTNLANRRHLDELAEQEWRRSARFGRPISILMIDIDDFKQYNDSVGHQAGDECLVAVAAVLMENGQRPGDVVARYGGEEFLTLLSETDADTAAHQAERIRWAVEALGIEHPGLDSAATVSVSIGVASEVASEQGSWKQLVSLADDALYQAKAKGKNRVHVSGNQKHVEDTHHSRSSN